MKKALALVLTLSLLLSLTGCGIDLPIPSFKDLLGDYLKFPGTDEPTESTQATAQTVPEETETQAPPISEDNPYYNCYFDHDGYVLPNSDTVYYCRGDLFAMTAPELEIARQEMYARHGRSFGDYQLQEYFDAQPWYTPSEETELNTCEEANLFLLDTFLAQKTGDVRSNRYIRHMPDASNYAMAGSDKRYLRAADLSTLEHDHLVVIRNEIYARRGYTFKSEELKTYFYCTDWYKPNPKFKTKDFNKYESANITLCDMYERKLEGVKFSSKNPYKDYYYGPDTTVMSYSSTMYLSDYDLYGLPSTMLALIRNEILARNGYTFENKHMQEFFLQCDWYKPDTPPGSTKSLDFSDIERYNIDLIKAYEAELKKS